MTKLVLSTVFVLAVTHMYVACLQRGRLNRTETTANAPLQAEDEQYQIYSAVLRDLHTLGETHPIILAPKTSVDGISETRIKEDLKVLSKSEIGSVLPTLIDQFIASNSEATNLLDHFKLTDRVAILTEKEIVGLTTNKNGWKDLLRRYPGNSVITLSRVGLDHVGKWALVYAGVQSGGRTGRGQYIFLQRESGSWVIKRKMVAWVS